MSGIRFMERLRKQARAEDYVSPTTEEILASVIDYVSKILNTRQGSTVLAEDFGIPDFTSVGVNFSIEDMPQMEENIAKFVEHCEPRLKDISVHFAPDPSSPLQISFSMNASLIIDGATVPVHLITRVASSGKVSVGKQ